MSVSWNSTFDPDRPVVINERVSGVHQVVDAKTKRPIGNILRARLGWISHQAPRGDVQEHRTFKEALMFLKIEAYIHQTTRKVIK